MRKRQVICEKALPRLLNHLFSGFIRWMKQNYLQKYFFYDSLIVMAVQLWLVRRPSTSKITPKILALTKGCDDEHLIKHRFQKGLFLSVYKSFWQKRWTRTCIQNHNPRSPQSYRIIVADAADAVSVNFSGRCKFFSDLTRKFGNLLCILP